MSSSLTNLIHMFSLDSLFQESNTMTGMLHGVNAAYRMIGSVVLFLLALLGCFLGYKLVRIFMSVTGFIAGAALSYLAATQFLHTEGMVTTLCIIGGGLIVAGLSYWIYRIGIFILCFVLAFAAASSFLPVSGDITFFLSLIIGLAVGILAVKYLRPVIILTSAIVCGSSAATLLPYVMTYLNIRSVPFTLPSTPVLCIIVSALGILVQFLTTKEPVKRPKFKHEK